MIELKNIEKVYNQGTAQEVRALKGITLSIEKGEIFGVIGLSGAGKSTLIRHINMLERPTSGTVIVNGEDLTAMDEVKLREARRHIGMIFQSFNLLSSATVAENIAFPLKLEGKKEQAEIDKRVTELLDLVGLADKADMYPAQLSGGQKQRVGIARALANNPKILLCDEATSALDPKTTTSILQLLLKLRAQLNLTIVIITHQMEVIKECCDRVAVIDGGVISEMGTTLELFTDPQQALTKRLVSAAVRRGLPELLRHTEIEPQYSEGAKAVVELLFLGPKADAPVIVDVAIECKVKISMLGGSIDHIQNEPFGLMVVEVGGTRSEIEHALSELRARVHKVDILGYDKRKQLADF
ncbi:MAG: methionine ABC transporter ATP-binding protein [Candidatus Anaerobiospirillum pullicola]|uniref:Cell division ATP-binding protein FtsE n=1 Tax=Candidatus Anaerobiospirillum pullicola TaxID=2838451 RepID=A0A948TG82_9GAMM|nr:methionine ABC transporter ATP-binding protein [Candidatus Anaerobiospirillum pullicola]